MTGEDLHDRAAVLDAGVGHKGQKVLGLERIDRQVLVQPLREALIQLIEHRTPEGPAVHGHRHIAGKIDPVLAVLGVSRVRAALFDVHALHHVGQAPVLHLADAAGDIAVFRHGVAQQIGDHGVLILGPVGGEKIVQRLVGRGAVEVVGGRRSRRR